MIVYDITIYIIPTHTIDDIHTPVSSGIGNPLPLSDHTTVSFRSLQMTVLLIPFLPTGKIGPTKIPLTPVISEMLLSISLFKNSDISYQARYTQILLCENTFIFFLFKKTL